MEQRRSDPVVCIYSRCKKEIPTGAIFCPWCGRKQIHETKKKHRRANGSGSVYKVGGKRRKPWIALKDGHSIGSYFATEREALTALASYEAVQDIELFNLSVSGVYERWSKTAYQDCKPSFKNDYANAWKHFPESLKAMRFRDVKAADVQSVIDSLFEKGKSKSVQNKVKSLFSFLCTFGMSNDIVNKNYASFLKVHETEHRKDSSVFTFDELELVISKADGPENDRKVQTAKIVMIYLFTGMRLSELLPLPVSAVHLDGNYPYLVGGEKTEAGRNRVIPIISTIRPHVQWFYDHATGDSLFSAYNGNADPKHWRERDYKPLLKSLGIPYHTPHGTRRSTATMAVEAQVDPAALQKIGGWKEFDTIQKHYNKPDIEYLYREMEKLETARANRLKSQNGNKVTHKKPGENPPSKRNDRNIDRD